MSLKYKFKQAAKDGCKTCLLDLSDVIEGLAVLVRGMTGLERADFVDLQSSLGDKVGGDHLRTVYPFLVKKLTLDPETKERIWGDEDDQDILELAGDVLERIAKTALQLSGLGVKAEEEAAKNS